MKTVVNRPPAGTFSWLHAGGTEIEVPDEAVEYEYRLAPGEERTVILTDFEGKTGIEAALSEALDCRLDLLRAVQDELKERVDAHNEAKEEEPLSVSAGDLAAILTENGATEEEAAAFRELFTQRFGTAALSPENLLDLRRFEVKAGDVTVHASQEQSWQVQTREIDGRKYILIPTDGGAELNGFAVKI